MNELSPLGRIDRAIGVIAGRGIAVSRDLDLSGFTYLRTGGTAAALIQPGTVDELCEVLTTLRSAGVPVKVIGATSNILFLDDARYGVLVSTIPLDAIRHDPGEGVIIADAGAMLPDLARFALHNSIGGFAGLEGIPGTLGGAVFMNAGAYGYEIKDTLLAVDALLPSGEVRRLAASELALGHRSSAIRQGTLEAVILRCFFRAAAGDPVAIEAEMEVFHAKRHKYQDFLFPNLGSIFSASPYRALGRRDRLFRTASAVHYALAYRFKPFRRESPINRKWLNALAARRFGLDFPIQSYSNKTLNCLVNRGQGTSEMLRYIDRIQELADNSLPLENEVFRPT